MKDCFGQKLRRLSVQCSIFIFFIFCRNLSTIAAETNASGDHLIFISKFEFSGNSVFSDKQLQGLLIKFEGKTVTVDKLHQAKETVTKFYIANGYINSGAIFPDQDISDGVVEIAIIEGEISSFEIKGDGRLNHDYVIGRLSHNISQPFCLSSLQLPLYQLHNDPVIKTVHAELKPTDVAGKAALSLELEESSPYKVSFGINNHRSPNIGEFQRYIDAEVRNMTGWNEVTGLHYANTNGLRDYAGYFSIPINYHDTQLMLNYQDSSSTIINDVFKDLDIDSSSRCFDIGLRHPFFRDQNSEFAMSLKLKLKRNETTILGNPFQYTDELTDGISRTTVVSFGQEWINRSAKHALTVRSTFDFGVNTLNATIVDHPADGEFITWLGQLQWLRRLPFLHSQLLFKTNLRLSDDTLPPSEKFAIGGFSTVRGYRENALTADQGFTAGVELRMVVANLKLPKISNGPEDGDVYLIPFLDYGKVWNKELKMDHPDIGSVGIGLRWIPRKNSTVEIFWGHALRDLPDYEEYSLQDDGIHFNVKLSF